MIIDESENSNVVEIMRVGARIQKFEGILREYRTEFKQWQPEDERESAIKEAKESLLFSLMDDYNEIFESVLE